MDKFRILAVDDDPQTQLILSAHLWEEYEGFSAGNGLDALLQLDRIQPDIVIVDVLMPVMNGLEFVRRLRSYPRFEKTIVIFLSARDQDSAIRDGYKSGADVYITKPFDPETIRILIRNLIEDTGLLPSPKTCTAAEIAEFQRARSAQNAPASPSRGRTPAPPRPRVLIVDDDPVVRELLAASCEPEFEVLLARNGLEALDQAYLNKPDLFIIDWMLPRVSGAQVVRVLQSTLEFLRAPIFFISAHAAGDELGCVERLQVAEFFAKPLDPDALLASMRRAVSDPGFRIRAERPALPRKQERAGAPPPPGA